MNNFVFLVLCFASGAVAIHCPRVDPQTQNELRGVRVKAPIIRVLRSKTIGTGLGIRNPNFHGRVECLEAIISREFCDKGTRVGTLAQKYRDAMGARQGDQAGHIVAKRLGGTGDFTYNFIPMNVDVNNGREWKIQVEKTLYDFACPGKDKYAFVVEPLYGNDLASRLRPHSIRYSISGRNLNKNGVLTNTAGQPLDRTQTTLTGYVNRGNPTNRQRA